MITRRHMRFAIAVLLPLLALRVLVPAGYMLDMTGGTLRMVLCDAGGRLPPGWSAPAHMHDHGAAHHHAAGHAPSSPDDGSDQAPGVAGGDCLFAHAAVNATASFRLVCAVAPMPRLRVALHPNEYRPSISGPPRQVAARAPPFLSATSI